jgi:hypothetical protein
MPVVWGFDVEVRLLYFFLGYWQDHAYAFYGFGIAH